MEAAEAVSPKLFRATRACGAGLWAAPRGKAEEISLAEVELLVVAAAAVNVAPA